MRLARALVLGIALGLLPVLASAHRDGCHAWHACQPDADSPPYVCGDLGYTDYCGNPPDTHTTLVDFQPPQPRLTPSTPPPPPPLPYANPTGAAPEPPPPPRPPIQRDCAKDRVSSETRQKMQELGNDPATETGCLTPITDVPSFAEPMPAQS